MSDLRALSHIFYRDLKSLNSEHVQSLYKYVVISPPPHPTSYSGHSLQALQLFRASFQPAIGA